MNFYRKIEKIDLFFCSGDHSRPFQASRINFLVSKTQKFIIFYNSFFDLKIDFLIEYIDFWRSDPMILYSFLWRLRNTALESRNSKQIMVYDQITYFIKFSVFLFFYFFYIFLGCKKPKEIQQNRPKTQIYRGFLLKTGQKRKLTGDS